MVATVGVGAFVTRAEFSRRRGVSKAAVTGWAKDGRIKCAADGRVDVVASEKMLAEYVGGARGGARRAGQVGVQPPADGLGGGMGSAQLGSLVQARTAVATIAARRAETEHQVRLGQLVERDRYAKAIEDGLAPILSALDSLPALIGPDVAAETDVRKVQNMLDDAIAKIRADMATTLQRLIAGPDVVNQ